MTQDLIVALATVVAAGLTALAMVKVAKMGRRSSRETDDWKRVEALWGRVDTLEEKVTRLENQNGQQQDQIDRLQRWKEAALRYISALIDLIHHLGGTPPEPPDGYTPHT